MKNIKIAGVGATFLILLAIALIAGAADGVRAGSFNPAWEVTVADSTPELPQNADFHFVLPAGDVNVDDGVFFVPHNWGFAPGTEFPVGTVNGHVTADVTLGLLNGPCSTVAHLSMPIQVGSLDTTDTVEFKVVFADSDRDGIKDGVEKFPAFVKRAIGDLQPFERAVAITRFSGVDIIVNLVVFPEGTVLREDVPHDVELGYPTLAFIQDYQDPGRAPEPDPLSDACSPLDFVATGTGSGDSVDQFVNPKDGKYSSAAFVWGQPDGDGDGYENALDTCPFDTNEGDPRVLNDGDADGDGLDLVCDPDDGDFNMDEDADMYFNRQDNCPLVANGEDDDENQKDSDEDDIGDACDTAGKGPQEMDGERQFTQLVSEIKIGSGTGPAGPPAGFPKSLGGGTTTAGGGGLGALTVILIVAGVLAAAVVVGGSTAFYLRRAPA